MQTSVANIEFVRLARGVEERLFGFGRGRRAPNGHIVIELGLDQLVRLAALWRDTNVSNEFTLPLSNILELTFSP
jgi:hypothetical protein